MGIGRIGVSAGPIRYDPKSGIHGTHITVEGVFDNAADARTFSSRAFAWWKNLDELVALAIEAEVILRNLGEDDPIEELARKLRIVLNHYREEDSGGHPTQREESDPEADAGREG
jgi:hypothetical protein